MARTQTTLALSVFFALVLTACGGSSDSESAASTTTEATSDSDASQTTTEAPSSTDAPATTEADDDDAPTTTEAVVEDSSTTTEAPATTVAEVVADDGAVVAYCTAHDEIDAFFDADFPADDELVAAIDEQQVLISTMTPPDESIVSAHESYAGALLDFYDVYESNGYDISDERFNQIFGGLDVGLAERIIEQYRVSNCDGFDGTESEIVSGSFSFELGQCINQSASGEFDESACDEPHDYQVFYAFDVADGDFPGEDQLIVEAESTCLEQFEPFVGVPFSQSIYYATTLRPTLGSWSFGDREIVCLAQAEVGQLAKDIEGSSE